MGDAPQVDVPAASPTAELARLLIGMRGGPPPRALRVAKQCLLDWLGVTLAARHEPLVSMLVA